MGYIRLRRVAKATSFHSDAVRSLRSVFAFAIRSHAPFANSHLRCSNSDCAHAVHLHHFAGHDMQRLRKMQYFALHPETAHHFPACIHLPPLALQNVNLRCAAEFHAQARQENGDGILLTAKLDRKFFPFSPQRADEIPCKAAESDCAGRDGRCRSAHNGSGRRCQLKRRGQMQEHFGSAQG